MQGRLLTNLPAPPLSNISADTANPTPGVLPLRISRTTSLSPPIRTLGEIKPDDTTVASQVLRSPLRTAGWPLMNTRSEPSAMYCTGIGACRLHVTWSICLGKVNGAGVATVGRHSWEKKPLAMSRKVDSGAGCSGTSPGVADIAPAARAAGRPLMKTLEEPLLMCACTVGANTALARLSQN